MTDPNWDWDSPFPLGVANAADSAGSVAAALFAGFSLTLIGLIIPDTRDFRWSALALFLVAAAAVLFIASVQCSFWAKQYAITPDELEQWYRQDSDRDRVAYQHGHQLNFLRWVRRMNTSYRVGILFLLSGMAITLVPSGSVSSGRLAAIAVICAGLLGELLWILSTWILAGSPSIVFDDDPDEILAPVRLGSIRKRLWLRRVARLFVPLARVTTPRAPEQPRRKRRMHRETLRQGPRSPES